MIRRRPIGQAVTGWTPPSSPDFKSIEGKYARLDAFDPDAQAEVIHAANKEDAENEIWTYLPYGPFETDAEYRDWMTASAALQDPYFLAIFDKEKNAYGGVASYLRVKPNDGSIEVGHINFAPQLQKTRAATEAIFLMMDWAFSQGYRRFEWKCDALNA